MSTGNADQIAYWNAASGHKWAEDAEKMDAMMQQMAECAVAAAAPQPGETVIDIGCGSGATALMLSDRVGSHGRVLGVDVSQPMLAVARQRAAGRLNLEFAEADAATTHFHGDADLVFSKFGVMFFNAPAAAFRNIHTALKPGGRLAFMCWREMQYNQFGMIPYETASRHLPPQPRPDPHTPGPFAFGDAARVGHILTVAGFQTPAFAAFDTPMVIGSSAESAAREAVKVGMASRLLKDAPQETKDKVMTDLAIEYGKHMGPQGVTLTGRCWVVTATA